MYKVKSENDNVTFYFQGSVCVDIDVEPGVKKVVFSNESGEYCKFKLRNVMKHFPDVTEIEIAKNVTGIQISNFMFPNVRKVVSHSWQFQSGKMLIQKLHSTTVLNTFCCNPDEILDMSGIDTVGDYAFEGCMAKNFEHTNKLESCTIHAFHGSALDLCHDKDVVQIGGIIVYINNDVKELKISKNVKYINSNICIPDIKKVILYSFSQLSIISTRFKYIETVFLDTVNTLDFENLKNIPVCIDNLEVNPDNPYYTCKDGILYTKDGKKVLLCMPGHTKQHIDIPDGVTNIGNKAFERCNFLHSVTFPDSLSCIANKAFNCCQGLEDIDFGNGIQFLGLSEAFARCDSLKHVKFPSQLVSIGRCAFTDCRNLESVEFNDGLQNLESMAFYKCEKLKKIKIPSSVLSVGQDSFSDVEEFWIDGNIPDGFASGILNTRYISDKKKYDEIIVMHKDGRDIYVPKNVSSDSFQKLDNIFNTNSFETNYLYAFANGTEAKQNIAIKIYEITGNKKVAAYLRRTAKNIALRFLYEGSEDELIKFLQLNIMTTEAIKSILDKAQNGKASVTAYIMNTLENTDSKKESFRL